MIQKADNFLEGLSKWGIIVCVSFMLSLTLINITLRWFEMSVLWIEPLVRHLVFFAAFLGGSLATGSRNHIKIDVLARILEKNKGPLGEWIQRLTTLVTLIATAVLTSASYDLAKIEFEFGKEVFLNIHSGTLISIIPVGMSLISLRLLFRFLLSFKKGK